MPDKPRRGGRAARVIAVEPDRFAAGRRLVAGASSIVRPGRPAQRKPDLVVDVVRPADLVAFTVECFGLELVGGSEPALRPKTGASSRLVVQLPFQHLAERAIYEAPAPVPNEDGPAGPSVADGAAVDGEAARPVPPIPALPARSSRLVFDVPAGEEIPFTVAGILDAVARLPMIVHPLATPAPGPLVVRPGGPSLHLPGGLVAAVGASGLAVSRATRGTAVPDAATVTGLSALARDLRRARSLLAGTTGVAVRLGEPEEGAQPLTVSVAGVRHVVPSLLGRGGLVRPDLGRRVRPAKRLSRPPTDLETAIEAPFRLVISPSKSGGWSHAREPVGADGAAHRVELWHTRLGVRREDGDEVDVDEKSDQQRIVRAVWARDREAMPNWETAKAPEHKDVPFRSSLDGADRHMLVRQSAETWLGKQSKPIEPRPVAADALWLSSLGAWLDLHGQWQTMPYSEVQIASILSWDHVAPMGRDQYVRVVYPGYLYPFGHRATLVKLTERKMKDASPSVAGLYQRKFLVVGEPVKHYDTRKLPFISVRIAPLVTPTLDDPGDAQNSFFFPLVGGQSFRFVLHCQDREGRPVRLLASLLWVAEHHADFAGVDQFYSGRPERLVPAAGQEVAFTAVARGGDTMLPTDQVQLGGKAKLGSSDPHLVDAAVRLPAVQQLSPVGAVTIKLAQAYLDHGFGGAANSGEVWAEVVGAPPNLSFGGSTAAGSDRSGGFLQPDLPIRGLSRVKGTVGDVAGTATSGFDPAAFLAGALPKLFGIVPLDGLLEAAGVDLHDAPDVVSEALDRIEGFLGDLERAKRAGQDAVANANLLVARAQGKAAELQQQAAQALQQAQQLEATVTAAVDQTVAKLTGLANASQQDVTNALAGSLQALRGAADAMDQAAPLLPPLVREQLRKLAAVIRTAVDAADLVEDVYRFLNGLGTSAVQSVFRFEWRPKLKSWPDDHDPILEVRPDSLVLAVDGRASGKGEMGVETLAELRDFSLNLLPGAPLVRFKFDHLSFRSGSSSKAEVDVVLQEIEFLGLLGFVETLKELIPFDGFSDPPYVDVTPEGLTAGFSLGLPNVSIGVFNLSNMALGADVQVPFLGSAVTVGFNFCTRERPFALAVTFIGGGGWFLMRLSPDGLDVLELGLEAGAMLAVDFGVASGSISAMLGIYMRLEGDAGSLTGYFRLRGEVDVLGLISASIELYLALAYQFDTGKMVGVAKLTIKIEVFIFSGSVTITAERRFAGSAGDPSFADIMVLADGTSPAWTEYCTAFSKE